MGNQAIKADDISKRIKALREESGLTQAKLAELSGVSPAAISLIEKGERLPSMIVTRKIATALKVSFDELTGIESQNTEDISKESQVFFRTWQELQDLKDEDKVMIKTIIKHLKGKSNDGGRK